MRILSALLLSSSAALSCALAPACSSDAAVVDTPDGDDDPDPRTDASLRDARADAARDAAPSLDGSTRTDASDAEADGDANDAGTPEPGDPCSPTGARYERGCGTCGRQVAVCDASNVVSGYGACVERHPGFCEADAGAPDSGLEDAGADLDATTDAEGGGSSDPWQGYSIDLGSAGQSVPLALPEATGNRARISAAQRLTCPATFPALTSLTDYGLVRVRNTSAQIASVELAVERGFGPTDTILAVYAAPPTTDAQLLQCLGFVDRGTCPDPVGGALGLSCLLGSAAVQVPAGAAIYVSIAFAAPGNAWNGPSLRATVVGLQ